VANIAGFWDPLVALFGRMTEKGFLHKAFLGHDTDEVDLPVMMVSEIADVIPAIRTRIAGTPRAKLEETGRTRLL
jgi:hypothetical protein